MGSHQSVGQRTPHRRQVATFCQDRQSRDAEEPAAHLYEMMDRSEEVPRFKCQQTLILIGNDSAVLTKHHKLICQWVASTLINSNGLGMVVAAKRNKGGEWNTMVTHS